VNEAIRDWVASVETTHYLLGSVMGPHPYPWMVRELQRVIGTEARAQCQELLGGPPQWVLACIGGGSNASGIFTGFVDTNARLVGVQPSGGAAIGHGAPGIVHGSRSHLLQDEDGQVLEAESISAGLDYPGVGPEHSHLAALGRAEYVQVDDAAVLEAVHLCSRLEGIVPALEPAHALAWLIAEAGHTIPEGDTVLVNLCGRGDKDAEQVMHLLGDKVGRGSARAIARDLGHLRDKP